jgi:hypothetical protein
MGIPSTNTVMGTSLLANEPKILEYLSVWNQNYYKLGMGLPKWVAKDALDAKEKIVSAFEKWGLDDEGMMVYLKKRQDMLAIRGIDQQDQAIGNFGVWMA